MTEQPHNQPSQTKTFSVAMFPTTINARGSPVRMEGTAGEVLRARFVSESLAETTLPSRYKWQLVLTQSTRMQPCLLPGTINHSHTHTQK